LVIRTGPSLAICTVAASPVEPDTDRTRTGH
jgi:hypothetical protein